MPERKVITESQAPWRVVPRTDSLESIPNSPAVEKVFASMRQNYRNEGRYYAPNQVILKAVYVDKVVKMKNNTPEKDAKATRAMSIALDILNQGLSSDPLSKMVMLLVDEMNGKPVNAKEVLQARRVIKKELGIAARLMLENIRLQM